MLATIIFGKDKHRRQQLEKIIYDRIEINDSEDKYDMEIVIATDNIGDVEDYLEKHKKKAVILVIDMQEQLEINSLKKFSNYEGFLESIYLLNNEELIWELVENRLKPLDVIRLGKYNLDEFIGRIREDVDIAYRKYCEDNIATHVNLFTYSKEKRKFDRINQKEIIAFETIPCDNQKVLMHLANESIKIYGSLKKYEDQLEKNVFFRCNRNVIINLENVVGFDSGNKVITMQNGKKISVSVRKLRDAKLLIEN